MFEAISFECSKFDAFEKGVNPDKKVGSLIFEVDLSGWSNSFQIQFLVDCRNSSWPFFQEVGRRANVRLQDFKQQVWDSELLLVVTAQKIIYSPGN